MVHRKSKPAASKWKITDRCQRLPEIEQSEATTYQMGGWNVWTAIKGFKKAWIMETVKSAQDIYTRCKNPSDDRRRK